MSLGDRSYMRSIHHAKSLSRKTVIRVLALLFGVTLGLWYLVSSQRFVGPSPVFNERTAASVPSQPSVERTSMQPASRYAPFLNAINPASNELRALAYAKTKTCPAGDKTCAAVQLYRYVQQELGYLSDPVAREHIQSPETTLQIGAGDCEDLSILLASLLENVGVPTYLVFTPTHAYTLACDVDGTKLFSTVAEVYTAPAPDRASEETKWIEPHTIVSWGLNSSVRRLSYTIDAGEPIDWIVVPTAADAEAVQQGKSYRHYPGCSREAVTHLQLDCSVSDSAQLLARNRSDQAVRVAVTLRYQAQPIAPQLPASLQTYRLDGTTCLTLDPSIKGRGYPGEVMPSVVAAPQRLAINRSGREIALR